MSIQVRLLLATEGGGVGRSDRRVWSCLWCLYRDRMGSRLTVRGCGRGSVRQGLVSAKEEVSMHERFCWQRGA